MWSLACFGPNFPLLTSFLVLGQVVREVRPLGSHPSSRVPVKAGCPPQPPLCLADGFATGSWETQKHPDSRSSGKREACGPTCQGQRPPGPQPVVGRPQPHPADGNRGIGPLPASSSELRGPAGGPLLASKHSMCTHRVPGQFLGSVVTVLGPVLWQLLSQKEGSLLNLSKYLALALGQSSVLHTK